MPGFPQYYQILGLENKDATVEEIRAAYRRESLRWWRPPCALVAPLTGGQQESPRPLSECNAGGEEGGRFRLENGLLAAALLMPFCCSPGSHHPVPDHCGCILRPL